MKGLASLVILALVGNVAAFGEDFSSIRYNQAKISIAEPVDAYPLEVVEPRYPSEMRRKGINGQALVKAVVSEEGVPERVELISASVDIWRFGSKSG